MQRLSDELLNQFGGAGGGFRPEAVEPLHFRFAAEPGQLALGVIAVPLLGTRDGLRRRAFAAEMFGGLAVSQRAHGEDIGAVARKQSASFFDEALLEHGGAAAVDVIVERSALRAEADAERAVALESVAAMVEKFA